MISEKDWNIFVDSIRIKEMVKADFIEKLINKTK